MTDLSLFRIYEPHELGDDGYPRLWHAGIVHTEEGPFVLDPDVRDQFHLAGQYTIGVKHLVRQEAEHRCVRCGHPFIVGQSGVMDGPQADAKAFAAELGVSVEVLDSALELFDEPIRDERLLDKAPRTNWSPCDEHCTHAGPARAKRFDGEHQWFDIHFTEQWATAGEWAERLPEVQAAWRILTVHHLNGRKHDLRWWNLISVCQRCHLWLQRRVIMERVYPFEHDDYFKPYAAGWYAYAYLGVSLTREQTVERMDELLALERVA